MVLLLLVSMASAGDAAAGKALYAASCTACHGPAGNGKGPAAIALKPKPADFTAPGFWTTRTDAQVGASIRAGRPNTAMTGFVELSETEVADLVAYLHTFTPVAP
jgi:mono/diheme cytochrome c family protein